jgi:hypothetical protein
MTTFFDDMSGTHRGVEGDLAATIAAAYGDYDKPDIDALQALTGAEILFALYVYENYSGDSQIIYQKDGKIFENTGSHCSCNGLEGQWGPAEVTLEALAMRPNRYRENYDPNPAAAEGWDKMMDHLKNERQRQEAIARREAAKAVRS